ncbi:pseudouridine synthase [Plasticicumulans acidivorans]|uniref:23S rRNA-/tRNA-specific pseudouridylate synthase n=1 Tax=Plasticicumulans acidivorans TaxID=886464 RepID=A0A317MQK2_9GAMM|nr:pseudouridine synthase [Plasticicumulans acidivorans]PWV58909.1 23S rRNA-/tRNA-specific pseudouridylate synthase [Plasticicumulans acidivorans]
MNAPLPSRDGVAPSCFQVPETLNGPLLEVLCTAFPAVPAASWRQRLARGEVAAADGRRLDAGTPVRPGLQVFYYREPAPETPVPFREQVLYRDPHLLVVDKPHFLAVVPAGRHLHETLLVRLRRSLGLDALVPLHRIDRETAGLVVFSLNPASRGLYSQLFPQRAVRKTYLALAPTQAQPPLPALYRSRLVPGEPFFRMQEVAGEPNAETRIERLDARGTHSLYRLEPLSGRKHQLRVQMAALGRAIVNDRLYPLCAPADADDFSRPLQLLASELEFRDPLTGGLRHFTSRFELQ